MRSTRKAHIALFLANFIYGVNYSVAKEVMPQYIQPFGFIVLRVVGATLLFWTFHHLFVKEKVERQDLLKMAVLSIFGVAINQMFFFKGLSITTPINASILMASNPITVLIVASILIKERVTINKVVGVAMGITGTLALLLFSGNMSFGSATALGDLFIFINATSYAVYLVLAKPLMHKYHPLTVIKWVFTFGLFMVLPFGVGELGQINWTSMPTNIVFGVLFVIVAVTFMAYLFNIYALKHLSPTVVSSYLYLQPVLAGAIAILYGKDSLDVIKIMAAILIFVGVYLVSRPLKKAE